MQGKTCLYVVKAYNNYSEFELQDVFFLKEEHANNYIEFMKSNDVDSNMGYISYKIEKRELFLSENNLIVDWINRKIVYLTRKLNDLKNRNCDKPDNKDYKKFVACENELNKNIKLLKEYQKKLLNENESFFEL